MMANNNSSSMMKHHQESAAAAAVTIQQQKQQQQQQQQMSYHHHHQQQHHHLDGVNGGGGARGGSSVSTSVSLSSPSAALVSYNNGKGSVSGVVDSCNTTATAATATRFQPYLHGISMDWTLEEQAILDEGIKSYASETSLVRYAKIAVLLKNKTVRDVALRCKWMTKRDSSRRRKDDLILTRKSKERKEKVTDPSAMSSHALMQPAIDGFIKELLQHNAQAFKEISANLATYQIKNNINLLSRARDNISHILKRIYEPPYVMKKMPALPVMVNEELANSILPQSTLPLQ